MLSYDEIPALVDRLEDLLKHEPERITYTYQKVFNSPEGKLILIDLMDRFFEFSPTSNDREAGAQAVLIYIKNCLLGEIDLSKYEPPQQGEVNAQQS